MTLLPKAKPYIASMKEREQELERRVIENDFI